MRPSANRLVALSWPLRAALELEGAREGVGDRRPFLDVGDQRVDLALRNALAFHVDFDPDISESDRFLADVAGAPDRGNVEVTLKLKFELVDDPAAMHGVGVEDHRKAGAQGGERGLRRIGGGGVAQK